MNSEASRFDFAFIPSGRFQETRKTARGVTVRLPRGRHFGGPSHSSEKTAATSADDLHNIIANGKGHMPKYTSKLTSGEIDTLVEQIKTLSKK